MRTLLIVLSIILSYTGLCQEAAFVVVDVSGSVTYGGNKKALIGSGIGDKETIMIGKPGSVTLACKGSGYAKLSAPGKYTINSADYCKTPPNEDLARLCKFAWHQFTDKETHDDWRNHLENKGAATRGAGCFVNIDSNIAIIYYCQGDFALTCTPKSQGAELFLKIYRDENSAPFLELPLKNNAYQLADLKNKLKEGHDYYWNVAPKDAFCGLTYSLHMISKHDRDSIVTKITTTLSNYITNKAEREYSLGIELENMHFFADALACYKEAAKLSPADKRYSKEVAAFKTRYNIK